MALQLRVAGVLTQSHCSGLHCTAENWQDREETESMPRWFNSRSAKHLGTWLSWPT